MLPRVSHLRGRSWLQLWLFFVNFPFTMACRTFTYCLLAMRFSLWLLCNWQFTRAFTDRTSCFHDMLYISMYFWLGVNLSFYHSCIKSTGFLMLSTTFLTVLPRTLTYELILLLAIIIKSKPITSDWIYYFINYLACAYFIWYFVYSSLFVLYIILSSSICFTPPSKAFRKSSFAFSIGVSDLINVSPKATLDKNIAG